jgi:hypothetical protein
MDWSFYFPQPWSLGGTLGNLPDPSSWNHDEVVRWSPAGLAERVQPTAVDLWLLDPAAERVDGSAEGQDGTTNLDLGNMHPVEVEGAEPSDISTATSST